MSAVKKVLKNIISGGFEAVKDSAKQIGQTVGPGALVEAALGQEKPDEFKEYLKSLGDKNLTPEELEKKKKEIAEKEEKEKSKLRSFLQSTPAHLRPSPQQREMRPYEVVTKEKEEKEAREKQLQEKMPKALPQMSSKAKPGGLFARKKGGKGFEGLQKDTKVG